VSEGRIHKLNRETLHDRAYHELRAAIMAGRFAPGERLTVRGIAEELGVSPMPVRSAFARLIAEKIVSQNASGGIELPEMSRDEYVERLQLRALLEGQAAYLAASRATPADVARLGKLADALTEASENGDARGYVRANKAFKFAVVTAARSEPLMDLVERLWLQVGPFMHLFQTDVHHQAQIDRHHQAVAAIARHDAAAASDEITRDILDGIQFLLGTGA